MIPTGTGVKALPRAAVFDGAQWSRTTATAELRREPDRTRHPGSKPLRAKRDERAAAKRARKARRAARARA